MYGLFTFPGGVVEAGETVIGGAQARGAGRDRSGRGAGRACGFRTSSCVTPRTGSRAISSSWPLRPAGSAASRCSTKSWANSAGCCPRKSAGVPTTEGRRGDHPDRIPADGRRPAEVTGLRRSGIRQRISPAMTAAPRLHLLLLIAHLAILPVRAQEQTAPFDNDLLRLARNPRRAAPPAQRLRGPTRARSGATRCRR